MTTNSIDDGYQGIPIAETVTPEQSEAAALAFQISDMDQAAWNFEDREQYGRASAIRAKIRPLQERLNVLVAGLHGQVKS